VTAADRHDDILRIVELRERVSVGELTERLGVSEVTIRKDLALLEERGKLVRTRGGARAAQDRARIHPIEARLSALPLVKERIAAAAAETIREGETIFLDSGSTCLALARAIVARDLRVVTNSLDALEVLAAAPHIALHATGGGFREDARSFIGPAAVDSIRRFHFDRAFIGSSGVTDEGVFSTQNAIEGEVKRAAIAQAQRTVVLVDSSKIGSAAFSIFARPEDVEMVIVEAGEKAEQLRRITAFEVVTPEIEEESQKQKEEKEHV
jgi:DeoR/GlpR family transcriptional regulator of sugar metabolism